jgi:hypothetical protein
MEQNIAVQGPPVFSRVRSSLRAQAIIVIALLGLGSSPVFLGGCGGGGSSTSTQSQSVTVTVSSTSASVLLGDTQQLTATVTGTSNTALTWTVNGVAGGNSTTGTIPEQYDRSNGWDRNRKSKYECDDHK